MIEAIKNEYRDKCYAAMVLYGLVQGLDTCVQEGVLQDFNMQDTGEEVLLKLKVADKWVTIEKYPFDVFNVGDFERIAEVVGVMCYKSIDKDITTLRLRFEK